MANPTGGLTPVAWPRRRTHRNGLGITGDHGKNAIGCSTFIRIFWKQQGVTGCSESAATTTPAATETRRGRNRRCGAPLGLILGAFESWQGQGSRVSTGATPGTPELALRRPWRRQASAFMASVDAEREGGRWVRGNGEKLTTNETGWLVGSGKLGAGRNLTRFAATGVEDDEGGDGSGAPRDDSFCTVT